ncbi:M23 family metallopeptidase [Marinicellulosiphila megalodicopiae]|uniref:M23 family metallopeptidase n=1 Tax=Marinicellulosiphila megalodicopiae TaxID=2724896 RepID=UPI003BB1636F
MRSIFKFTLFMIATFALANEPFLDIKGQWIQGGLLHGQTSPENAIYLLDQQVFVDEQGRFILGLGRDAQKVITLTLKQPDQTIQEYSFEVTQREYDIQSITGIPEKYVEPDKSVTTRIAKDSEQTFKARQTFRETDEFRKGFIWPLLGRISGVYGSQRVFNGVPSRPHFGLDIAAPTGTPVNAPASGVVTLAHDDMYYSGGTLIIDHGQSLSSTFLHLSKIHVKEGDIIKQGQLIADVGSTGRSTGPHLDWRMNWHDQRIDPFLLLPDQL